MTVMNAGNVLYYACASSFSSEPFPGYQLPGLPCHKKNMFQFKCKCFINPKTVYWIALTFPLITDPTKIRDFRLLRGKFTINESNLGLWTSVLTEINVLLIRSGLKVLICSLSARRIR